SVPDVFGTVFSLRDKSLLKATEVLGETRYVMLETLREYALEKLGREGDPDALRRRHAARYLETAGRLAEQIVTGDFNADDSDAGRGMALELDNMRAGMDWAMQRREAAQIAAYGRALGRFFLAAGYHEEGERRLAAATEACRQADDLKGAARLLLQRGLI